jgi:hypothetical protein
MNCATHVGGQRLANYQFPKRFLLSRSFGHGAEKQKAGWHGAARGSSY